MSAMCTLKNIQNRRGTVVHLEYRSVCPIVGIGSPWPLPPPPQASVSPPLDPKRGGESIPLLRVRGRGGPIRTTGWKAWHSVDSVIQNKYS